MQNPKNVLKVSKDQESTEKKQSQSKKAQKPMSLEDQMEYFNEKHTNIQKLKRIKANIESLKTQLEEITTTEESFELEDYYLTVTNKPRYNNENHLVKVHNKELIIELLEFSIERMEEKREKVEKLILS